MERTNLIRTSVWIVANVSSSVGLILTNKIIMGPPFNFVYVFTLTSIHFFVTTLTMELLAIAQVFSPRGLSITSSALMSIACALSVGLMNASLKLNNLDFYQLCKILGIPWLVFIQAIVYKISASYNIKISLTMIIIGMGLTSVKYIHPNFEGTIIGIAAVIVTTQFQIWQSQKQHEYQLNAMQINHAQALPTFVTCAILALSIEFNNYNSKMNILSHTWTIAEIKWIILSGILAACVNLCSYGLIGNTSTITFQVVGHAKTILVLFASYYLEQKTTQIRWNYILGIIITLSGTVLYGFLRHNETNHNNPSEDLPSTTCKRLSQCLDNQQSLVKDYIEFNSDKVSSEQDELESV